MMFACSKGLNICSPSPDRHVACVAGFGDAGRLITPNPPPPSDPAPPPANPLPPSIPGPSPPNNANPYQRTVKLYEEGTMDNWQGRPAAGAANPQEPWVASKQPPPGWEGPEGPGAR